MIFTSCISGGPVMRTDPLGKIDIAVKSNSGVSYLSAVVSTHVLFSEEGKMG